MKKHFLKPGIPLVLLIIATLIIGSGCPSEDPDPPVDTGFDCTYSGYSTTSGTFVDTPEGDLITDYFYTSSNGPEVEIYLGSDPGALLLSTKVVTLNGTGPGTFHVNNVIHQVTVTCHKEGNAVNEEFWYEVIGTGISSKYCVMINTYH